MNKRISKDELLSIIFRKGIIPAMKDEVIGRKVPKEEKPKKPKKDRKIKPEFQKPEFSASRKFMSLVHDKVYILV